MDEVIGMTSGYDCGKRRKSGTVGYLLNQSSDKPSITTTGGKAKLRRQLRFILASFLATSFSSGRLGKQAIFSIARNSGEGGPPYFNGKGGIAISQSFLSLQSSGFHSQEVGIGVNR
ncbi:hypothetical protein KY284_007890 [Solanum tuberosum]|nr:hypothetical protein KY284_007890 [Solanum tuberosum]